MNRTQVEQQSGFSLLELIIVMAIFSFVITAASTVFISSLSEFKHQGSSLVSNIEGIVGLEMMRRDIQNVGYGLYTAGGGNYEEVTDGSEAVAVSMNDAPSGIPRPVVIADDAGWNKTDRIALKAVNVTLSGSTEKSVFLSPDGTTTNSTLPLKDQIAATEQVIVISPELLDTTVQKILVPASGGYSDTFANIASFSVSRSPFSIVFVVDPATGLKMPFNRADYYVGIPTDKMPVHCAPGTGVLFKRVVSQTAGQSFLAPLPLLDCVADMQVAVESDDNNDGTADDLHQGVDLATWTPTQVMNIRKVLVFILVQDGQKDKTYTYPNSVVRVGSPLTGALLVGRDFDFNASGITEWQRYRWKLYTLVVKPLNLR